jgi:hypothetical protein
LRVVAFLDHQPPFAGYSHGVRAQYHFDAFFIST